ncbi:hypothetical protein CRG98_030747 [Punica granatum]|uniref:Uncharacterized protein n=1 Tax=Punica granatum TaxID=22663 RepID=A0A2I0IY13_PUNGR|nr:hypothetical protein CRG98_030747 [Punica granatum]
MVATGDLICGGGIRRRSRRRLIFCPLSLFFQRGRKREIETRSPVTSIGATAAGNRALSLPFSFEREERVRDHLGSGDPPILEAKATSSRAVVTMFGATIGPFFPIRSTSDPVFSF